MSTWTSGSWRTAIHFHKPAPTDGSWWVGLDRDALRAYIDTNTRRMSSGYAASFVPGGEKFGLKDRESGDGGGGKC
jgi:hypothetical protein